MLGLEALLGLLEVYVLAVVPGGLKVVVHSVGRLGAVVGTGGRHGEKAGVGALPKVCLAREPSVKGEEDLNNPVIHFFNKK